VSDDPTEPLNKEEIKNSEVLSEREKLRGLEEAIKADEKAELGEYSNEEEIPTAAETWFDTEEKAYKPIGTSKVELKSGDELVRRQDHEQALVKAGQVSEKKGRQAERERIINLIEEMKQEVKGTRLYSADVIEAFSQLKSRIDEVEQADG
jgi:hypothetical protein